MVTRNREDAEATRQKLLDTALTLFSASGPAAVTMKQVALAAGVTHGAMYWHFRNKEDLLRQLHQQLELPFERHYLEQRQAVQQDALKALELFMRGSLRALMKQPKALCAYRLFHYGRACAPDLAFLQPTLDAEVATWQQYLRYFLKQARKQKQLSKKLDLDLLAAGLLMAMTGAIDLWISTQGEQEMAARIDYLLALQLEGLRSLKRSNL